MEVVECTRCGEPVVARSSRCWRCGHPVVDALIPEPEGLGTLAQASVIVAIFAIALVGLVVMTQRQQAIDRYAEASARAVAAAEGPEPSDAGAGKSHGASPSPIPAPDAAGPGTYTVQPGDSLFSVASDLGLSANELIFWNKETYPTLQSTPALTPGWVLATTGPPLPTQPAATPPPQLADLPTFGPDSFPASESVTVGYYDVSGSTPQQISYSMEMNGPYSDWLGLNATAHVEVSASFNFSFEGDPSTTCTIIPTAAEFVTVDYHVVLPAWDAPTSPAPSTVAWWTAMIQETVTHEGHHISVYESYRTQMNQAVQTGTCASVEADLVRIMSEADRVNCEFDLAEYAAGLGLTLESCLSN